MTENELSKNSGQSPDDIPTIQKFIAALWPSFLVAGVETIVFFTFFDPLYVFTEYDVTRTGAYSIGFFIFWGFALLSSILAMYFAQSCKPCAVYKDDTGQSDN